MDLRKWHRSGPIPVLYEDKFSSHDKLYFHKSLKARNVKNYFPHDLFLWDSFISSLNGQLRVFSQKISNFRLNPIVKSYLQSSESFFNIEIVPRKIVLQIMELWKDRFCLIYKLWNCFWWVDSKWCTNYWIVSKELILSDLQVIKLVQNRVPMRLKLFIVKSDWMVSELLSLILTKTCYYKEKQDFEKIQIYVLYIHVVSFSAMMRIISIIRIDSDWFLKV